MGLMAAGLVAALAAALLVGVSGTRGGGGSKGGKVTVMVAAEDLPAMTLVRSDAVTTQTMSATDAPKGYFSDPGRIIGRVLRVPMVKGQVLLTNYVAAEDSPAALAAVIPEGMRAIGVSLSDYASLEGLLYPGGVVDVLASIKRPSGTGEEDVVVVTLLRGVQVLAVEGETVVTSEEAEAPEGTRGRRKLLVKLLVTPKQAEELHLVQEYARLSLALRNPLEVPVQQEGDTGLRMSEVLSGLRRRIETSVPTQPQVSRPVGAAEWPIVFIRGGASEVQSVSMPEQKKGN